MASSAALLLLADGRFPSGGHAHSGGLEVAVADARVRDVETLAAFLRGRLRTSGLVGAALAAAVCVGADPAEVDAAADARTPAPALRRTSRSQGRALLRAARRIWPVECPDDAHQPVAFGAVARAAALAPYDCALASAYAAVTGPATAAVRLLGLDPYDVHAVLGSLGPDCEQVAERAAQAAREPVAALPAASAPLLDISAAVHATWEVRLFAS
jgi:urease accessory protein